MTLGINERWVRGYEGKYSIDRDRNVYSFRSGKRKQLKIQKNNTVFLHSYHPICYSVSKLFREAFHPTPIGRWVEGFEGAYSVSQEGVVYSYRYGEPREKKSTNGKVTLYCSKTHTNHTKKISKLLEIYK